MNMFRGYGRGSRRRGRSRVRYTGVRMTNHYKTTATFDITEAATTIFTGVDTPSNRSVDLQSNCRLKSVLLICNPQTVVAGEHQIGIWRQPGAVSLTTPIASFYATTEPVTQAMINSRMFKLSTLQQRRVITGQLYTQEFRFKHVFKGRGIPIRDGDDIIISGISSGGTVTYDIRAYATYYSN